MKRSSVIYLVVGIFILLLGFSVISEATGGKPEMMGNGRKAIAFRGLRFQQSQEKLLNLSEAQKQGLKEIRENFLEERRQLYKEQQRLTAELKEAIFSDETENELAVIKDEINKLQERLLDLKLEYWQKLKILLNPEQLDELLQAEKNLGLRKGKRAIITRPF